MTSPLLLFLVSLLCLALLSSSTLGQTLTSYEFCYVIRNTVQPSWWVSNHGVFNATGSSPLLQIQQSSSTRMVVSVLGQTHTEQLSGIATANGRVDTSLYIPPSPGYVDGSGIQLTIASSSNPAAGQGIMFAYTSTSTPVSFITNSALGLTSNLNQAINIYWTGSGTGYGERIDAGGSTITGNLDYFIVQPYNPAQPITNCTAQLYSPTCAGNPATPPTNSILFSITLNAAWSTVPLTYLNDLFQALTTAVSASTSYSSLSPYLGFYLFSCFPPLTSTTAASPVVWFYLNAASAQAMGINPTSAAATIYTMLASPSLLASAGLSSSESSLISSASCPQVYNGAAVPGACSGSGASTAGNVSPGSPTAVGSPTSAGSPAPAGTAAPSSSSSGLSGGAIAGIVVGSVVGVLLILLALLFCLRVCGGGGEADKPAKRFQDEPSQRSATHGDTDTTVEMQ